MTAGNGALSIAGKCTPYENKFNNLLNFERQNITLQTVLVNFMLKV